MAGVSIAKVEGSHMGPEIRYYPVEASETIHAGDFLVLVQEASNYNTPRVKKLSDVDMTDTTVKGIFGVAMADVTTSSTGAVTERQPSTVEANARATYAFPTISNSIPLATLTEGSEAEDKGKFRLPVAICNDWTHFWILAAGTSDATTTVNDSDVGTICAVQLTDTSTNFKADLGTTSGDSAALLITGVDRNDPNFNTASNKCRIMVRVKATHQQDTLGVLYTT